MKHGIHNFKQLGSQVRLMNKAAKAIASGKGEHAGGSDSEGEGSVDPRDDSERFDATAQYLKEQRQKQVRWEGQTVGGGRWEERREKECMMAVT